jgi:hypothetical protein
MVGSVYLAKRIIDGAHVLHIYLRVFLFCIRKISEGDIARSYPLNREADIWALEEGCSPFSLSI